MAMRYSIIALSALGFWWGVSLAAEPVDSASSKAEAGTLPEPGTATVDVDARFETDSDKANYSLGYELGKDLRREELELRKDALLKGVEDALSGAKPAVSMRDRRLAIADMREKRAQATLEEAKTFLAANAEKEGVTTLPSGLQYREIKGGTGKTPQADDKVTVNYRGTLIDGSEFDSSYARGKPATFQVKKVIKGWQEALKLMKEGGKWELYIPPELAYGKRGARPRIPPNSALVFEVELLSVDQ